MAMFWPLCTVLLFVVVHAFDTQIEGSPNPVEGVVKLLERLESKIKEEGKTEAAAYDKYACFCKDNADEKLYSITKKKARIAELEASIKKLTAGIEEFTADMEAAKKKKEELEAESESETAKRKKEHDEFLAAKADRIQGIDEILAAMDAVKEAGEKQEGTKDGLLQVSMSKKITELLGEDNLQPGKTKAYANKGGETIETLQKLHKDFKAMLKELMEDEAETKHAFDMEEGARINELMAKNNIITKCQGVLGEKSQQKAADTKEKTETETDKDEDQEFLDKLTEQCEENAGKWDARSKRRVGELTAMASALEILKGDATSKYGSNKLALASKKARKLALVQGRKKSRTAFSFLQVDSEEAPDAKKKLLTHLKKKASLLGSSSLATLVLALQDSPFDSVKQMIEDLITKIDEEQTAEDTEIEDCKNDLVDATKKVAKNGARIEEEEATIVEETASSEKSTKLAAELGKEVSKLFQELNEATELRAKEEKENSEVIADATAGKASMDDAIKVLKEFYDSDFETGFIQTSSTHLRKEDPDAPGGFLGDDPDEDPSKQGEAQGIFGLLGTIKGDYEKTLTDTKQEEEDSETNFNTYKTATEKEIADKQKMQKTEETSSKTSLTDVEQAKEDLIQWTEQKAGAQTELNTLKPRCLALGAAAEEQKKRRKEEKTALQEAITIIETLAPAEAQEFLQLRK